MESSVNISSSGITYAGADGVELFRAIALRSALRLLAVGIKPSRGWTMTKALKACERYTGKKYKRTESQQARDDMSVWIEAMKSAIPVTHE